MDKTPTSALADASGELLSLLAGSPGLDEILNRVVTLAAEIVSPAAACGLTVGRDEQPFTAANSSDLAAQVDEIQYGTDEGPCLESLETGRIVQVDDLSADNRWPTYRKHALAHGVVSSLSLPLQVNGQTVAALNLYALEARAFNTDARRHAEAFAAQCAAALALALRYAAQSQVQEQLAAALASRALIDQALGILMGQQRCTAAEAFDPLRRASQNRNRKLRDVAADLITNVTGHPPEAPPAFRAGASIDFSESAGS